MNRILPLLTPFGLLVALWMSVPVTPAYVPLHQQPKKKENSNALLKKHKDKVTGTASTTYSGYPVTNLMDGNPETTWFSATGDSAAQGTKPYVELEFPEDETVNRVNVLGNRDPSYPTGYSVLEGSIEFLDKDRKVVWSGEMKGAGDKFDFEFDPKKAIKGIRYIRFNSTKDQGDVNGSRDIALAEILVE